MVHQHFKLVECFTVLDNIILGAEPMHGCVVDRKAARKRVVELSEKYGLKWTPTPGSRTSPWACSSVWKF